MILRCRRQAVMVVADKDVSLTITGNGDVLEPHDGVIGEPFLGMRHFLPTAMSVSPAMPAA